MAWETVWITGGGSGLGRELAIMLAQRGIKVAISARTRSALDEVARANTGITAYPLDVTDRLATSVVVQQIERDLGPISLAILNAGVWYPLSAAKFDAGNARASIEVNFLGPVNGIEALLPGMIARRAGHIAMVASIAGYRGLPKAGGYAPSKAATISLAECLKGDLERYGIAVSIINPGFIETPMTSTSTFRMPFILRVDDAASRVIKGLERRSFEVAFPWQLVTMLKIARMLPYPLYFWLQRTFMSPKASSASMRK